ncbi:hypothetical protein JNJ66_05085 [Candidatus Saccharibacteria bacterium]|nr:hypothetical protein [Candidatus Saccharibacteria bacterium]
MATAPYRLQVTRNGDLVTIITTIHPSELLLRLSNPPKRGTNRVEACEKARTSVKRLVWFADHTRGARSWKVDNGALHVVVSEPAFKNGLFHGFLPATVQEARWEPAPGGGAGVITYARQSPTDGRLTLIYDRRNPCTGYGLAYFTLLGMVNCDEHLQMISAARKAREAGAGRKA